MRWRGHQQSELTSTEFPVDGDIEMDNFDTPADPAGGHLGNSSITADIQFSFPEQSVPHSQFKNYYTEVYPGTAQMYRKGSTLMDKFNEDKHATMQKDNLYYPWASQPEWGLASFLLSSSLSMATVDKFLSLNLVSSIVLY